MCDGTLSTWIIDQVEFELKEYVDPIGSRPYPVTKVHDEMLKKGVDCLVLIGFLEIANNSEWGSPSLSQPKPKLIWVFSNWF